MAFLLFLVGVVVGVGGLVVAARMKSPLVSKLLARRDPVAASPQSETVASMAEEVRHEDPDLADQLGAGSRKRSPGEAPDQLIGASLTYSA